METTDVPSLATRLAALERGQRRTRLLAALGIAGALVIGRAFPARVEAGTKTLTGEILSLTDAKGKERVSIGPGVENDFGLSIADESGHVRVLLKEAPAYDSLAFMNKEGRTVLHITENSDGSASMMVFPKDPKAAGVGWGIEANGKLIPLGAK
jgi:hypothetical protein